MKACVFWNNKQIWYVANLLGDGHPKTNKSDWGYTSKPEQAIELTPYWQKRFAADSKFCGRIAHFYN